ncbi:hypothetical protein K435DRAFT_622681, partial [Dendrothele bispora CBS 962.96]
MRRRAWWGVVWWDLYISDLHVCSPLIPVSPPGPHYLGFTTKLPAPNVDEKVFSPCSNKIPPAQGGGDDGLGWDREGMRWFEWRTRLTQLVRSIKRRMNVTIPISAHATTYYGQVRMPYTIDQAASMETEIKAFLDGLPSYYRVDLLPSPSPSTISS